ncbi:MAG: DUF262 domain-containing HNH endonuclease family protein [Melioribacteraceae bacterium]|nr:DUF262 domain-containing HNH endonuclease family protein [Melioribacteraceae bacterium]
MNIIPKDFTLHSLFNNPHEQFRVPSYQRRYAWRFNQQAALFKDIDMLLPGDGHLFGMLILHTDSHHGGVNKVDVVDGQQRLTTISILLLVLYKKFKEQSEEYKANQIAQLLYCGNPETSNTPKLVLGELDNPDYLNLLKGNASKIKNRNILGAYQNFKSFIDEACEDKEEEWLSNYYDKLIHTAKIIRLDVQQAQDAYKLFETINNRGLKLSSTDILKNFILGHAAKISPEKLSAAKDLWSDLIIALDGIPTDDFFRQYVSSVYTRKISNTKLIEEFKKHYFRNVKDVDKLGEYRYNYGLEDSEELYNEDEENGEDSADEIPVTEGAEAIEDSKRLDISDYLRKIVDAATCYSKIWNRKFSDRKINSRIEDLQSIRSFPSYIYLMHYLQENNDKKEIYKILDMIGALMLRRHMTGRSTAYNDDIFAKLLRIDHDENYIKNVREALLEDCPDDDEFKDRFPTHELKQRVISRARYILSKLEYEKTGGTNEFVINSPEDVHVEHIIPQKIDTKKSKREYGDWESYLGDKSKLNHKKRVHRIGNMTLLASELNISASNNPFSKKKKSYKESNIFLTKELGENRDFKFYHLDRRGENLAELAVNIWKL